MPDIRAQNQLLIFWGLIGLLFLISAFMRLSGATPDVSWLISMCERILAGEVAYIDIIETAPPIPMLLYMPGVILAHVTPLSAEASVYLTSYLSVLLALTLTARILPRHLDDVGSTLWHLIFPAALFLLVLCGDSFAQREHFAGTFALPMIAVLAAHEQDNHWPRFRLRMWAGIFAGMSAAIKAPIFAIPFVLFGLFYLFKTKDFRGLYSSGLFAAAAASIALTAISLVMFPHYLSTMAPIMRDLYVPLRAPFLVAFVGLVQAGYFVAILLTALWCIDNKPPKIFAPLLIIAFGFLCAYILQGKYYSYQLAPSALLIFVTLWILASLQVRRAACEGQNKIAAFVIYAFIIAAISGAMFGGFDDGRPKMKDMKWAADLNSPTVMAISPDISAGFPLARQIDAVWIDRVHSQWAAKMARIALSRDSDLSTAHSERMLEYYESDIEHARRIIREKRPELIIQAVPEQVAWLNDEMIKRDPMLLSDYAVIAEGPILRILRRTDAIGSLP